MSLLIVVLAVLVLSGVYLLGIYNSLIILKNRLKNAFAQIDVQLKRRYDLIPNLVESVKGYMKHERETLESVIRYRNQAIEAKNSLQVNPADAEKMREFANSEVKLKGELGRLVATFEAYPDLKANQTVGQLMEELSTTENKISFSRQAFNDAVLEYNIEREKFPNSLLATLCQFQEASPLKIEDENERKNPQVKLA